MKSSLSRGHNICTDKSNSHHTHHKETSMPGGPSGDGNDISVSEILSQTNSVLYECDDTGDCVFVSDSVIANSDMASNENKVRGFIHNQLKLAKELVDQIAFERVHRMGSKFGGNSRKIVAKCHVYKEKEVVMKQWKHLKGTSYYVSEQFPKEVVDKRKQLYPNMKAAQG